MSITGKQLRDRYGRGERDFSGVVITDHHTLGGAQLPGIDLSQALLWDAVLTNANLRGADFSDADLTRADFSGADLRDAKFGYALLMGTKFFDEDEGADLRGADLRGAFLHTHPETGDRRLASLRPGDADFILAALLQDLLVGRDHGERKRPKFIKGPLIENTRIDKDQARWIFARGMDLTGFVIG